jgi:hypothetical protein
VLAQDPGAEKLLREAVRGQRGETEEEGWLRRALRERLLALVGEYTLARFREEEVAHGGVGLLRVEEELEGRIDESLVKRVRGSLPLWALLVMLGLPGGVPVQTYLVLALLK